MAVCTSGLLSKLGPAMCGVMRTFSMSQRGESSGSGSVSVTSRIAPPKCPRSSANTKSSFRTKLPRPTFTKSAPCFIARSRGLVIRPTVSGVDGRQLTTISAFGSSSSRDSIVYASSKPAGTSAFSVRRTPVAFAPKACMRRATFPPRSPMPRTSARFPQIVREDFRCCQICDFWSRQ